MLAGMHPAAAAGSGCLGRRASRAVVGQVRRLLGVARVVRQSAAPAVTPPPPDIPPPLTVSGLRYCWRRSDGPRKNSRYGRGGNSCSAQVLPSGSLNVTNEPHG
jgi:hypothetical protein